jgi:hypothetical protein
METLAGYLGAAAVGAARPVPPVPRGPVQDESGALDPHRDRACPISASSVSKSATADFDRQAGMDAVEGRAPRSVAAVPPYAHGKTAREQGGASS